MDPGLKWIIQLVAAVAGVSLIETGRRRGWI
jgi:hypothetical protein